MRIVLILHLHGRQTRNTALDDVRGTAMSKKIPVATHDPERRAIRQTMKSVIPPYPRFKAYYPLEDAIDMYNELWFEDSSSDN